MIDLVLIAAYFVAVFLLGVLAMAVFGDDL